MPSHAQADLKEKIRVLFETPRTIHLGAGGVCVRGIIVYGLFICLGEMAWDRKTLF